MTEEPTEENGQLLVPYGKTFWDVWVSTRRLQVSDPRDIIYAFLSHPTARGTDGQTSFVLPDYAKDVGRVYTEVATEGLCQLEGAWLLLSKPISLKYSATP
jgi:hypothetical protein